MDFGGVKPAVRQLLYEDHATVLIEDRENVAMKIFNLLAFFELRIIDHLLAQFPNSPPPHILALGYKSSGMSA